MEKNSKESIYLFDIAGPGVITFFSVLLFSVSIAWNAIVLVVALASMSKLKVVGLRNFLVGIVIISIGGAVLDFFAYILPFQTFTSHPTDIYDKEYFAVHGTLAPSYPPFRLYFMILPIIAIGVFNYLIARKFFKLDQRSSIILGLIMGLLTAPWLVDLS